MTAFGPTVAREVAQIPKNVWEYWLILLNIDIGCGRAEQGLFRHANQPLSAQFVNLS
jgi:hypothetical protein